MAMPIKLSLNHVSGGGFHTIFFLGKALELSNVPPYGPLPKQKTTSYQVYPRGSGEGVSTAKFHYIILGV